MVEARPIGLGLDAHRRGVDECLDVRRLEDVLGSLGMKALPLGVKAPAAAHETISVHGQRGGAPLAFLLGAAVRCADPQVPMGRAVAFGQFAPVDGPAAVRHPAPRLKVDVVQGGAAAAPDVGGAAKKTQAAVLERIVGSADVLADAEGGAFGPVVQAAAFQQQDAKALAAQAPGERDACGAGTDDADIGLGCAGCPGLGKVSQHLPAVLGSSA